MRNIGLFNLTYGTGGLVSSISIGRHDGSAVSLWVMIVGAAAYLDIGQCVRNVAGRIIGRATR